MVINMYQLNDEIKTNSYGDELSPDVTTCTQLIL